MENMQERWAVVTGASKGIGLAITKTLVQEGYRVFGLSRNMGGLENLAGAEWIFCNVADEKSVKEAFAQVFARTEKVDVLICNAGMGISGAAEFTPETDYMKQIDINFQGAVRTVQQVISSMREKGRGRILFISSLGAIFPLPFQSYYSASKAALNAFSDALGLELAPFGIQTSTFMLNDVKTEFTDNRKKTQLGDDIYQGRIQNSVGKMEASERNGMTPEQIATAVMKVLKRRKMPPHKIVGFSNELLGILCRLLPARGTLWLLGKIYG